MKNISTKKTLAIIGTIVVYFIAIYVILKDPSYVEVVLIMLIGFVCALFGIKAYTGIKAKNIEANLEVSKNTNHQEEK